MSCSTPGCPNAAGKLKCPECTKLGLPESFFCSQECFRASWSKHKLCHLRPEDVLPSHFLGFQFTGPLRPAVISPRRSLPDHIPRPDYAVSSIPHSENRIRRSNVIDVLNNTDIEKMRRVCRAAREVLDIAGQAVEPGVTTDYLDEVVHNACIERGVYPSPLNYNGFPKSVCTSINEIICHGIPDSRKLEEGDIVNIDVSTFLDGFHGDVNATYPVGHIDEASSLLIKVSRECLDRAIALVKPGQLYKNLGEPIENHARANGFQVVRRYCGHGIHRHFHCNPSIPHYFPNKTPGVMKPGHVFTIEPMINAGSWKDVTWPDNWTSATEDGKRSSQFEETLLVTNDGVEILTGAIPSDASASASVSASSSSS